MSKDCVKARREGFLEIETNPCRGQREPDFDVTSVSYDFAELLARAEAPQ